MLLFHCGEKESIPYIHNVDLPYNKCRQPHIRVVLPLHILTASGRNQVHLSPKVVYSTLYLEKLL